MDMGSRKFPHSPPPPVLPMSCSVPWPEAELVEGGSAQLLGITAGWELRGGQANLGHSSGVMGVGETVLRERAHWELWAVVRLSPATDGRSRCSQPDEKPGLLLLSEPPAVLRGCSWISAPGIWNVGDGP